MVMVVWPGCIAWVTLNSPIYAAAGKLNSCIHPAVPANYKAQKPPVHALEVVIHAVLIALMR
jgi:hypothetical protein